MRKKLLLFFALLTVPLLAWLGAFALEFHSRDPRGRFADLPEFESSVGAPHTWSKFSLGGRTYFEARRPMPPWVFPRGATCYVFDDRGRFQAWIEDDIEDRAWRERWGSAPRAPIAYKDALRGIAAK